MIALMTVFLLFNSCLDEIELDVPRGQTDALVVRGSVSIGYTTEVNLIVDKLFTFDGSSTRVRVKVAELISDKGESVELDFIEEGVYKKVFTDDSNIKINTGTQYKIKIELFDGRIIESKFEELKAIEATNEATLNLKQESIVNRGLDEIIDVERIVFDVKSEINNIQTNPQLFRWFVRTTSRFRDNPSLFGFRGVPKTCYRKTTFKVEDQILYNGFESNKESETLEIEVFSGRINDPLYYDTLYFNVIQESLSPGAYNYFFGIGETLKLSGSMFDAAPGKIRSNLFNVDNPEEEIFGYFYASEQLISNVKFTPDLLGNFVRFNNCGGMLPPGFRSLPCTSMICCDCSRDINTSIEKPDYWN